MEEKSATGFGFAFSKKKENKLLKTAENTINDNTVDERDFLNAVEGKELKSLKPKEEVQELVIPLIGVNRWRSQNIYVESNNLEDSDAKNKQIVIPSSGDHITDEAIKELIQEAKHGAKNGDQIENDMVIPLWMQNKIPEGYETDDKLDVSLRPSEPSEADYDQVPVDKFGLALLRGMGWKPGEGVGKNKKLIKPIEAVIRPKGLGLGADRAPTESSTDIKSKDEKLTLKKGAHCVLTSTSQKGQYGVVEGFDEDNARCFVKLAISNEMVAVSQRGITLVTAEDFQQNSKILNKEKFDRFKDDESERKTSKKNGHSQEHSERSHQSDGENRRLPNNESTESKYQSSEKRQHSSEDFRDLKHRHSDKRHRADKDSRECYDFRESKHRLSERHHHSDDIDLRESKHRHSEKRHHVEDDDSRKSKHRLNERWHHAKDDYLRESKHRHSESKTELGEHKRQTVDFSKSHHKKEISRMERREEPKQLNLTANKKSIINRLENEEISNRGWLRPLLRVRIVDENYRGGNYFKQKVIVEDVLSEEKCVCLCEDGRILDDVSTTMVETVVPRNDDSYVLIVHGKHSKEIGKVLKRDKFSSIASVQLLSDRNVLLQLPYDDICEFVGDVTAEMDY